MQVKTTNIERVWQSTDGKRTIWAVTLKDQSGSEYRLKTYSPAIASLGFNGEVESYFARSGDRFVRQKRTAATGDAKAGGYQRDDNAIRAQWAIGQAINLAAVKMDKSQITLPVIEEYAKELFATVSRVKGEPVTPKLKQNAEQYVSGGLRTMPAL